MLVNSVTGTEIFKVQKQPPDLFLKDSQNSQGNTCARVSFLIKAQVFSREFSEIFKNTFFASNCFSKNESFVLSENISEIKFFIVLKIFGKYLGTYLYRIATFVKLQAP